MPTSIFNLGTEAERGRSFYAGRGDWLTFRLVAAAAIGP